jgi:hypothetical protein
LIKENREHPEKSLFFVRASGLELGMWEGKIRAENIHLTKQASIVVVELGKRPLTGTYIKSVADQDYGKPPKQFTFVEPPKGSEFEWAFYQPLPTGMALEQIHSLVEPKQEVAQVAMAFHADRATFDRIRPPNLEEIPFDSFSLRRSLQREVVWWRKTTTATKIWGRNACDGKNYHPEKGDKFRNELIVLTWDEDGLVQYFWWGRGI